MLRIHQRSGQKSRIAGISLAIFSLAFLGLSLYFRNNIIFQIDSIVCLLAAIAVFLRGEGSSMQTRIVNKMLQSSGLITDELSSLFFGSSAGFGYSQIGSKVTDVVVSSHSENLRAQALETSTNGQTSVRPLQSDFSEANLIPPGRALAELYERELNLAISTDLLIQSLRSIICERFELGSTLSVKQAPDGNSVEISLSRPAVRQSCPTSRVNGIIGCPISSMIAVLFSHATKRIVRIQQCTFDEEKNELKIFLTLDPGTNR